MDDREKLVQGVYEHGRWARRIESNSSFWGGVFVASVLSMLFLALLPKLWWWIIALLAVAAIIRSVSWHMELRPGSQTEFEAHRRLMDTIDQYESDLLWDRSQVD